MKLTQATLPDYFTIADHTNSWYTQATNTFDFVDRNSDTLVVTVGDSWTWGCDLTPYDYDNNYRIQNVYGNQVAEKINSDWLNLSLPASGNFWLATQVTDLAKVIPNLEYNRIYVICTFTETGRWFNTKFDLDIDYIAWFKNNIQTASDFDQLLSMINQRCVTKIQTALPFDHVQLRVGTNMVDQIGFDSLPPQQLLVKPWYQTMHCTDDVCAYTVIDGVKSLLQVPEFLSPDHTVLFKEWMLTVMPAADTRLQMLENPDKFSKYHPTAQGHAQWAEYILSTI